jgi:hypothetical protein
MKKMPEQQQAVIGKDINKLGMKGGRVRSVLRQKPTHLESWLEMSKLLALPRISLIYGEIIPLPAGHKWVTECALLAKSTAAIRNPTVNATRGRAG